MNYVMEIYLVNDEIITGNLDNKLSASLHGLLNNDSKFISLEHGSELILINKSEIRKIEVNKPHPDLLLASYANAVHRESRHRTDRTTPAE